MDASTWILWKNPIAKNKHISVSTPRHYKVHYINYPSLNFKVVVGPSQQFSIRPYECKIYNLNMNRFHNHMNQVPKFNALSTTHYMVLET
jgi:hypothetical protein